MSFLKHQILSFYRQDCTLLSIGLANRRSRVRIRLKLLFTFTEFMVFFHYNLNYNFSSLSKITHFFAYLTSVLLIHHATYHTIKKYSSRCCLALIIELFRWRFDLNFSMLFVCLFVYKYISDNSFKSCISCIFLIYFYLILCLFGNFV